MEKWNHHYNHNSPTREENQRSVVTYQNIYGREIGDHNSPSFSSSLLDEIYRSIDDERQNLHHEDELVLYGETMTTTLLKTRNKKKKQNAAAAAAAAFCNQLEDDELVDIPNFRQFDKKKVISRNEDQILAHKKSCAAAVASTDENRERKSREFSWMHLNSGWSSSDSSSGGDFADESRTSYGAISSKSSNCYSKHRPKPIRTSFDNHRKILYRAANQSQGPEHGEMYVSHQKHKHEGGGGSSGVVKSTKSKALKIYGDLKKAKQPISAGSRFASFLNSIFTAGNAKKAKVSSNRGRGGGRGDEEEEDRKYSKSANASSSTCSSATSFSRSCLSKTPSSSNGTKRSVRFYPVSVILDEDCQPCGHKSLQKDHGPHDMCAAVETRRRNSINKELSDHIWEKNRRAEEAARELYKKYQRKVECQMEKEDEDEDDDASCASSDLFELDNLNYCSHKAGNSNRNISGVGLVESRYREELPVYETTYFHTNRPIANGFLHL